MKEKRILYISGVGWNWIKQRPQFLAEQLTKDYEVLFVDNTGVGVGNKQSDCDVLFLKPWRIFFERFNIIKRFNIWLFKRYLKLKVGNYDILWIASPTEYAEAALQVKPFQAKVVYDCMDDHLEFSQDPIINNHRMKLESKIFDRADIVFCSSKFLSNKILKRYSQKPITIVNNALATVPDFDALSKDLPDNLSEFQCDAKKLTYVGTVAEWINVDLIKKIVTQIDGVEIFFFGPCGENMKNALTLPHVHLMGSVPHALVSTILNQSDALFMPFRLTELILSVNPVKLYEYIASGKPSIAPLYGESEQFHDYAYLYSSEEECIDIIRSLLKNRLLPKKTVESCKEYAERNTWNARYNIIKSSLDKLG